MNTQFDEFTENLTHFITRRRALKKFVLGFTGTFSLLDRAALALTCAGLALVQSPAQALDILPVRVKAITANAGSTAVLTPTADPTLFKASVTGVIQSSSLGTCVNSAVL